MSRKATHRPIRTCIGCGTKKQKSELLRIVRTVERRVEIDVEQKRPGRGAYLCLAKPCLMKALKKRAFARHLKVETAQEFYQELEDLLDARSGKTV